MTQPVPTLPAARARLIEAVEDSDRQIAVGSRAKPPLSSLDLKALNTRKKDALKQYFALLPTYTLSRCPHCEAPLRATFDPWGFDGFWWQEKRSGDKPEPQGCEHFRVLTGAVILAGPPQGGGAQAHLGGDAPFVIPAVLKHPGMTAVLSEVPMAPQHRAYPIAYFSTQPPDAFGLANPWTRTSCTFTLPDGRVSFDYKTDPWDFNLKRYAESGALRWLDPKRTGAVLNTPGEPLPFKLPEPPHHQLVLSGDYLDKLPPPSGEKIEPFGD